MRTKQREMTKTSYRIKESQAAKKTLSNSLRNCQKREKRAQYNDPIFTEQKQ